MTLKGKYIYTCVLVLSFFPLIFLWLMGIPLFFLIPFSWIGGDFELMPFMICISYLLSLFGLSGLFSLADVFFNPQRQTHRSRKRIAVYVGLGFVALILSFIFSEFYQSIIGVLIFGLPASMTLGLIILNRRFLLSRQ